MSSQGMSPEQQKELQAAQEAYAKATPEQRKAIQAAAMAQMTPEQKQQAEAAQRGMQDMSAFCERIKPDPADPDKALSTCDMVTALASCPSFALIGEQVNAETVDAIERVLLEQALESDAAGLRDNTESPSMRRNVLLLFWALYRHKVGDAVEVDAMSEQQLQRAKQLATKVLMQAQMLVPQQRWVQATLGVARMSSLLVNEVWSHDDDACKVRTGLTPCRRLGLAACRRLGLQPPFPAVAAFCCLRLQPYVAFGCSLHHHLPLQASTIYDCSPCHLRLQPASPTVAACLSSGCRRA